MRLNMAHAWEFAGYIDVKATKHAKKKQKVQNAQGACNSLSNGIKKKLLEDTIRYLIVVLRQDMNIILENSRSMLTEKLYV